MISRGRDLCENKKKQKDWILVQCVTKFGPNMNNLLEAGEKLTYRKYGKQEVVLCPAEIRSISYIEDICCQHFIKLSRDEALQYDRTIELLFSPKGPMLREDKDLTGRSIFYFCCDFPMNVNWCKQNDLQQDENFPISWELPAAEKRKKRATSGSKILNSSNGRSGHHRSRSARIANSRKNQSNKLGAQDTKRAFSSKSSDSSSSLTSEKSKQRKKSAGKKTRVNSGDQKDVSTAEENTDESLSMRKSVTFADDVQEELHPQDVENRRPSLPPPPPKFLGNAKADATPKRKRRESVSIAISTAPARLKKERPEVSKPKPVVIKPYEKPDWASIKVTVTFKDEKFSTEFLEYKTLEDLYSWLRKQLLTKDVFTPGADLLLSHDNLKFPLKASTANNTIANLPHYILKCEEITEGERSGGFGDTNSRFDTRFSLPLDMRCLEGVGPVQYLSKYCIVSRSWRAFYHNTFLQNDKDRDGLISYKELKSAMERLFVELAHPLLKRVLFLLGFDPLSTSAKLDDFNQDKTLNWKFLQDSESEKHLTKWQEKLSVNKDTFVSICALANRIVCREKIIDGYLVDTVKQTGTQLEDADFYNIEGKLRDFNLNPLTKLLLLYVKK